MYPPTHTHTHTHIYIHKTNKTVSHIPTHTRYHQVDQFLDTLINFDKENIKDANLQAIKPYLANPQFEPEFIRSKSFAAAGLCAWAINIVKFYEVFCDVEPKRKALAAANAELAAAQEKLAKITAKIKVSYNSNCREGYSHLGYTPAVSPKMLNIGITLSLI